MIRNSQGDTVCDLLRRWRAAFSLDYQALAVFRVGLGLILLFDVITRARDFEALYLDSGVMPLALAQDFLSHAPLLPLQLVSESAVWQGALFVLLGVLAIGVLIGAWTRFCLFGAWVVLAAIQARNPLVNYGGDNYLMILLFWGLFLPLGGCWSVDSWRFAWRRHGSIVSIGSVAFVLQLAVVYLFGFLSKSGELWRSGDAVAMVLRIDSYTSDLGRALLGHSGILTGLTYLTLAIELIAPLLLFLPRRWARMLSATLIGILQMGFATCMDLGIFPFVSLLGLVPLVRFSSLPEAPQAAQASLSDSRLAHVMNTVCGGSLAVMLLWNGAVSQVEFQRSRLEAKLPEVVVGGMERLRLDQSWSMFSPDPPIEDGWLVFSATLRDGSMVDLLQAGRLVTWKKPSDVSMSFGGDRWKAYFLTLVQRQLSWRLTTGFFIERWNQGHDSRKAIHLVQVVLMRELNSVHGESSPERVVLYEFREPE